MIFCHELSSWIFPPNPRIFLDLLWKFFQFYGLYDFCTLRRLCAPVHIQDIESNLQFCRLLLDLASIQLFFIFGWTFILLWQFTCEVFSFAFCHFFHSRLTEFVHLLCISVAPNNSQFKTWEHFCDGIVYICWLKPDVNSA